MHSHAETSDVEFRRYVSGLYMEKWACMMALGVRVGLLQIRGNWAFYREVFGAPSWATRNDAGDVKRQIHMGRIAISGMQV